MYCVCVSGRVSQEHAGCHLQHCRGPPVRHRCARAKVTALYRDTALFRRMRYSCCCRLSITVCFKLKARNEFPGECPRRFYDSDREILHASSMCPCEDLPCLILFIYFCLIFRQLDFFGKIWTTLETKSFRRKNQKETPPEVRPRDGHAELVCKFQGLSLKNGVDIWTFVRKNE